LIVDVHRHVIVEEMTAPAVPENWRLPGIPGG
jgi:hypothetical protein